MISLKKRYEIENENVCFISTNGDILWANSAWNKFSCENGASSVDYSDINYFEVCKSAYRNGDAIAKDVLHNLQLMIKGEKERYICEYPCHSPDEKRFFMMIADRYTANDALEGILIVHHDITSLYSLMRKNQKEEQHKMIHHVLSDIQHKYRQPLNVISLSLDMIDEELRKKSPVFANEIVVPAMENVFRLSKEIDEAFQYYTEENHQNSFNSTGCFYKIISNCQTLFLENNIHIKIYCKVFADYEKVLSRAVSENVQLKCGLGLYKCQKYSNASNISIHGDVDSFEWIVRQLILFHIANGDHRHDGAKPSVVSVLTKEMDGDLTFTFNYENLSSNAFVFQNDMLSRTFHTDFNGSIDFEESSVVLRFSDWKKKSPL